ALRSRFRPRLGGYDTQPADRTARRDGHRCCPPDAGDSVDDHERLPRRRAGQGRWHLGRVRQRRRHARDPHLRGASRPVLLVRGAFVLVELRAAAPLLDPRLFAHPGFATGSASLFLQFFALFAFFFVSLQYLQLVLGYGTLVAAAALLPMAVVIMPVSAVSG